MKVKEGTSWNDSLLLCAVCSSSHSTLLLTEVITYAEEIKLHNKPFYMQYIYPQQYGKEILFYIGLFRR